MNTDRPVFRHPAVPVSNQAVLHALGLDHLADCRRVVLVLRAGEFPRLITERLLADPVNGPTLNREHWRFEAPL